MRRYRHKTPRHPGRHRAWLRRVVERATAQARAEHWPPWGTEAQFESYLAFARELELSLRQPQAQAPGHFPSTPGILDPWTSSAQRAVAKWFQRGLSGRVMWLIGEEMRRGQQPRRKEMSHDEDA